MWCRWEGDDDEAAADDADGEAGGLGGLSKVATAAVLRESLNGVFRRVTDSLFLSVATCVPASLPSAFSPTLRLPHVLACTTHAAHVRSFQMRQGWPSFGHCHLWHMYPPMQCWCVLRTCRGMHRLLSAGQR